MRTTPELAKDGIITGNQTRGSKKILKEFHNALKKFRRRELRLSITICEESMSP
jgi:hypothetical protein